MRGDALENVGEVGLCGVEQAEVVEWAATADVALRDGDLEACLGEDGLSGGAGLRVVEVVPGVGPQDNFLLFLFVVLV